MKITNEQLACEYNYYLVQKLLKKALSEKLITVDEFNKISEKNRLSFSPVLADIIPLDIFRILCEYYRTDGR